MIGGYIRVSTAHVLGPVLIRASAIEAVLPIDDFESRAEILLSGGHVLHVKETAEVVEDRMDHA